MIIITNNQFIRAHSINHIMLDEYVENINIGQQGFAMKSYRITVTYIPENANPNAHNSDIRECSVNIPSRKDAYILFKNMTNQIREQNPDSLYMNKLLEDFLTEDDLKKVEISESADNFRDQMKEMLYDPRSKKVRRIGKEKKGSKSLLRKPKRSRK